MEERVQTITLYKYLSAIGLEKFVKEKTIKLSFGYEANDRFEVLRGDLNPKCGSEEQEAEFEAGTHIGFISLSEVEENPYMWGYYAEQYKGARLKFQFKVRKSKGRYLRVDAVAPRYKELFSINQARFDGEHIEPCEYEVNRLDKINTDLSKCTKNIISNKHISWEGEREYRILYSINNITNNDVSPLLKRTENGMFVTADLNRFAVALECGPFSKISISEIEREFAKDPLLRGLAVRRLSFAPGLYRTQCNSDSICEYESIVPSDSKIKKDELIKRLRKNEIHTVPECGWSVFMSAARRGSLQGLVDLYRDKQQIDKLDCTGCNALALATLSRSADCVQWLLEKGASIKSANQMTKNDALVWAASVGLTDYMNHLLVHGADICYCDDCANLGPVRNRTALHYAARNGQVECVKALVDYLNRHPKKKRIVLNMKDEEGRTPLMLAAWGKSLSSVKYLVEAGASVDETDVENSSALIMAAWGKHTDDLKDALIIETLLCKKANPNIVEFNGCTALTYAAFHGRCACMKLLMQYSTASLTDRLSYQPILKYAVLGGHVNCTNLLVEELMSVCNSKKPASLFGESFKREIEINAYLNNADEQRAEAMIAFLKEKGLLGELSSTIITYLKKAPDALMNLAKAGKSKILEKIISRDTEKELCKLQDKGKCTALMWSVYADTPGNLECVQLCLKHYGKDYIKHTDLGGCNVIMWAARKGSFECLKYLLDQADQKDILSQRDENGMTALMWAVWKGWDRLAELLLGDKKEDILMMTDKEGNSALDWASKGRNKSCIKFLLTLNAQYGIEILGEKK